MSGLKRELQEELDYTGEIKATYLDDCVYYSHAIGAFALYLIFNVELLDAYEPRPGADAKEVKYLSAGDLADYRDRQAEIIKKYGFGQDIDIPMIKS